MYLCVEDIGFNSFYVFGICVLKISVLPLFMYSDIINTQITESSKSNILNTQITVRSKTDILNKQIIERDKTDTLNTQIHENIGFTSFYVFVC
jgi:hypothetical protein